MKRRLRRCGSEGAASRGAAEDCAWRAGAVRKNAIRVSLQNCNWIERTFMSMTLLLGGNRRAVPLLLTPHTYARRRASVAPLYSTLIAEFSRTTLESTAVSDVAGKCEQKPMPT